jgi:hypothetical protein
MKVKNGWAAWQIRILYKEFSWKSSWRSEIKRRVIDLVVKCQLLVIQTLFQLQGSFFRAFGASSFTEAGFAWCAR